MSDHEQLDPTPDPLGAIAVALNRIAAALERQAPPAMMLKVDMPAAVTNEQAATIRAKLREALRREGRTDVRL